MNMRLKLKYRVRNEPPEWRNRAGKKNVKCKGKPGGNMGSAFPKGTPHPIGMSGRSLTLPMKWSLRSKR